MSGASKRDSIQPGLVGIDGGWDDAAPPDLASVTVTARPPAPSAPQEPVPFSDVPPPLDELIEVIDDEPLHIDLDLDPVEPKIDIAAASRAANTAAKLGRAPRPHTTMKMKAVDLEEALARSAALGDDEKKKTPNK